MALSEQPVALARANPQTKPGQPKNNLLATFGSFIKTAKKTVAFAGPKTDETAGTQADEGSDAHRFVNANEQLDQNVGERPNLEAEFDIDELNSRIAASNTQLAELREQFGLYGSDLEFVANIIAQARPLAERTRQNPS